MTQTITPPPTPTLSFSTTSTLSVSSSDSYSQSLTSSSSFTLSPTDSLTQESETLYPTSSATLVQSVTDSPTLSVTLTESVPVYPVEGDIPVQDSSFVVRLSGAFWASVLFGNATIRANLEQRIIEDVALATSTKPEYIVIEYLRVGSLVIGLQIIRYEAQLIPDDVLLQNLLVAEYNETFAIYVETGRQNPNVNQTLLESEYHGVLYGDVTRRTVETKVPTSWRDICGGDWLPCGLAAGGIVLGIVLLLFIVYCCYKRIQKRREKRRLQRRLATQAARGGSHGFDEEDCEGKGVESSPIQKKKKRKNDEWTTRHREPTAEFLADDNVRNHWDDEDASYNSTSDMEDSTESSEYKTHDHELGNNIKKSISDIANTTTTNANTAAIVDIRTLHTVPPTLRSANPQEQHAFFQAKWDRHHRPFQYTDMHNEDVAFYENKTNDVEDADLEDPHKEKEDDILEFGFERRADADDNSYQRSPDASVGRNSRHCREGQVRNESQRNEPTQEQANEPMSTYDADPFGELPTHVPAERGGGPEKHRAAAQRAAAVRPSSQPQTKYEGPKSSTNVIVVRTANVTTDDNTNTQANFAHGHAVEDDVVQFHERQHHNPMHQLQLLASTAHPSSSAAPTAAWNQINHLPSSTSNSYAKENDSDDGYVAFTTHQDALPLFLSFAEPNGMGLGPSEGLMNREDADFVSNGPLPLVLHTTTLPFGDENENDHDAGGYEHAQEVQTVVSGNDFCAIEVLPSG